MDRILKRTTINDVMLCRVYNRVFEDLPEAKTALNRKQKALFNTKLSALTRLAERFLRIEALEESDMHQYDLTLNALLDKKQYRLFNRNLKKAESISGIELTNMENYEFIYSIEICRLKYLARTGQWLKADNINKLIEISDLQYLINRMSHTITALGFQTRKPKNNYDLSVLEFSNYKFFAKYLNGGFPHLVLQMASIQLSLYQTDEAYRKFIELLEKHEIFIPIDELSGYYTIALNFCTRMTKKGKSIYFKSSVYLFKFLDKKNMLISDNQIPLQKMKNIVLAGCKIKEFDWVLNMIEKYASNINEKYRTDVERYNLGFVAFKQGNYKEAANHFLEVNNFQKNYDIDKRLFILKAYYEMEEHYTEPTAQLFRSVEAFMVKHKQFTNIDKKAYKNTIRIFYNLYRCKNRVGKMTLETLQQKVEQAEYITSKAWLLEKIEELRKRK